MTDSEARYFWGNGRHGLCQPALCRYKAVVGGYDSLAQGTEGTGVEIVKKVRTSTKTVHTILLLFSGNTSYACPYDPPASASSVEISSCLKHHLF